MEEGGDDDPFAPTIFAPTIATSLHASPPSHPSSRTLPPREAFEKAYALNQFRDAIECLERERQINPSPDKTLRQAKLCLLIGDPRRAKDLLLSQLEAHFETTPLTYEQARGSLWFFYKAIRMMGISPEVDEFYRTLEARLIEIRAYFSFDTEKPFDDIGHIVMTGKTFNEGFVNQDPSYFDQTIERTHRSKPFEHPGLEAERQKLVGAAYLQKAILLERAGEMSPEEILELLREAEKFTRQAKSLLEQSGNFKREGLETEGGELLRVMDNLALILFHIARLWPEDKPHNDALRAIEEIKSLSRLIGNEGIYVRMLVTRGDLERKWAYRHGTPNNLDLHIAFMDLTEAYEMVNQLDVELHWESALCILVNLSEIEWDLGMKQKALRHLESIREIFRNIQDARVQTNIGPELERLERKFSS